MPRQLALNFERGAELSPGQRKEIVTHAWEVAGPDAYPWLVVLDEDLIARAPTSREIILAEGLARALSTVITEHRVALETTARDETALCCELEVPTRLGPLTVVLASKQAAAGASAKQEAKPLGKLAANTGMASPLTVPLTEPS